MSEFVTALLGAFAGGLAGFLASWFLTRRADQRAVTDQLIAEFFSASFLSHRIAVSELWKGVRDQQTDLGSVASGFWYPGRDDHYTGPVHGEFNHHQHLQVYIGYVVRLAHALDRSRLDTRSARAALGTSLRWHDDLLKLVADAAVSQALAKNATVPQWTASVGEVREHLVIQ